MTTTFTCPGRLRTVSAGFGPSPKSWRSRRPGPGVPPITSGTTWGVRPVQLWAGPGVRNPDSQGSVAAIFGDAQRTDVRLPVGQRRRPYQRLWHGPGGGPTGRDLVAERTPSQVSGIITPGYDRDYWRDLLADAAGLLEVDAPELHALTRRLLRGEWFPGGRVGGKSLSGGGQPGHGAASPGEPSPFMTTATTTSRR